MADLPNATITPTAIPPGPRRNTQASTRLLHEWAQMQPWDAQPTYELRLGPTVTTTDGAPLTPQLEAMLRNRNWYADLVGSLSGELTVVEAKVVADFASIGQLEGYLTLVPSTPALRPFLNKPIRAVLLVAAADSAVTQQAINKGIRVEVFTPQWVQEYLTQKHFRRRSFAQAEAVAPSETPEDGS